MVRLAAVGLPLRHKRVHARLRRAMGERVGVRGLPRAALSLALLLTPLCGSASPAQAQPGSLTASQSDALSAYNKAVSDFKSTLAQRRAQIDAHQPLPNVPGQALYLARNSMMSTYKDLTD